MAMRRVVFGLLGTLLLVSCSNYDLLITRAIPSYMKKGAKVVNYCNPATEEEHFLIFQYGEGLYVNFFDKNRATAALMRGDTQFRVYDYAPRIDGESYRFVLDSFAGAYRPLSEILGCSLKSAGYIRTKYPYEFLISSPNGTFLFDLQHPERLIHFVAKDVRLDDDKIVCRMTGDLRNYVWEDPIQYLPYYLDSQDFEVVGTFDLDGNCLSFTDLVYDGIRVSEPLFIDDHLTAIRSDIDARYEAMRSKEESERHDRLLAKAREEAIPVSTIMEDFSGADTQNRFTGTFFPFFCKFSEIELSDRPDYLYRLKYVHSVMTTLYLYTNDESFADVDYPAVLNVYGHFYERRILGQTLWMVESDLLFDNGLYAGYH